MSKSKELISDIPKPRRNQDQIQRDAKRKAQRTNARLIRRLNGGKKPIRFTMIDLVIELEA